LKIDILVKIILEFFIYLFIGGHSRGQKIGKKEESLYDEFKARQAFDSLDRAID